MTLSTCYYVGNLTAPCTLFVCRVYAHHGKLSAKDTRGTFSFPIYTYEYTDTVHVSHASHSVTNKPAGQAPNQTRPNQTRPDQAGIKVEQEMNLSPPHAFSNQSNSIRETDRNAMRRGEEMKVAAVLITKVNLAGDGLRILSMYVE